MLNFCCANCQQEIQADYQLIGEMVKCPLCGAVQVVPDPLLPAGSSYHGYHIDRGRANSLLWTTYQATPANDQNRSVLVRIPTSFFLKRVGNFNTFIDAVIRGGSLNMPEFPQLLDRSVVTGKIYFVFEYLRDAHNLNRFIRPGALLAPEMALLVVRNMATALRMAWDKEGLVHQNLIPRNLRIRDDWNVRITNMGLSQVLLADQALLQHGFNIWDYRYMSPEFLEAGEADTPAVDIYALGGILHLLNSGHAPYEEVVPEEVANAPLPNPGNFNPAVPPEFTGLIHAMMARDPATRLRSWDEVIGRIDKTLHLGAARLSVTDVIRQSLTAGAQTGAFDPVGLAAGGFPQAPRQRRPEVSDDTAPRLPRPLPTDTVARLAPVKRQITTVNQRWRRQRTAPQARRQETEATRSVIFAIAAVTVVALMAMALFLILRPAPRRQAVADLPPDMFATPEDARNETPPTTKPSPLLAPEPSAPTTPAPTPPTAPATSPWERQLTEIDAFFQENPTAFAETLRRYQELLPEVARRNLTELTNTIQERISAVRKAQSLRIQAVTEGLATRAANLAASGDRAAAIRLLRDYDSEYAEETRLDRIRLALHYEQEQAPGTTAPGAPDAWHQFATTFTSLVPAILAGETIEAEVQLKLAAAATPDHQEVNEWGESLCHQLAEFREITPRLNDPKTAVAELGIKPEHHLTIGLAQVARMDHVAAREAFQQLPPPLATPLLDELARHEPRFTLQHLIQEAGFAGAVPLATETLLLDLTRRRLAPNEAGRLAAGLAEFSRNYGDSEFSREHANLIRELTLYCERILGTKVEVATKTVNLSVATGDALLETLRDAPTGTEITLAPGTYVFKQLDLTTNDLVITGGAEVKLEGNIVISASGVKLQRLTLAKGQLLIQPGSRLISLAQCRFEDQDTRIAQAGTVNAENCLFRGLHLKDGKALTFRHCTFLTPRRALQAAVRIDSATADLLISDSIIFGENYAVSFSAESGARERRIENTLWYADRGLAVLQEKDDDVVAERNLVTADRPRLKRFCRPKNNLHVRPQFVNAIAGDWRLVPGVPGSGKASDGQDMGVVAGP